MQRQAVPGGRAHLFKRDVGLSQVDVLHLTCVVAHKGALQALQAALTLQVLDQAQQRALTAVQRHEIHMVEHPGVFQLAQLGVHKTAAQANADARVRALDALGDAKRRIHRAGEGHGQQHQLRLVAFDGLQGQALQRGVDQVGGLGQGFGQRVKAGLAGGQALGVAHEFKAFVHGIAQHIGQVVQIQRGQVPGAVGLAQSAKSPANRVARAIVVIGVECRKAWAFGQKAPACNAVTQRAVAALQKRDDRVDADGVIVEMVKEKVHRTRALFNGQGQRCVTQSGEPWSVQQGEHGGQGQVFLHCIKPP